MHLRFLALLAFFSTASSLFGLGLATITYPVYLAYSQADPEIEMHELPFATRFAHPEFIGAALSAPYQVPTNDTAELPKNINLISACGIQIETTMSRVRSSPGRVGTILTIDLRNFQRPDYLPFNDRRVIAAVGQAIERTLRHHQCEVHDLQFHAEANQGDWKTLLKEKLKPVQQSPKAE